MQGIFKRLIHAIDEDPTADEATKLPIGGIIADFMIDLTSADGPGTMDGAICLTVLGLMRAMLDVKTFACGYYYKQLRALDGVLRPVEASAKKAHTQYSAHARALDHKIHHSIVGPIEAKLLEFGALRGDHAHEVLVLVVGTLMLQHRSVLELLVDSFTDPGQLQ